MIIKLRTRDDLMQLLKSGKSESWVVSEDKENQITNVEIYQFDGNQVLKGTFDKTKSSRTEKGRLIVGFNNAKIEKCNYKWSGQNPVNYGEFLLLKEIKIGNQIWMSGNLNIDQFRNGDKIPEAKTAEDWKKAGEEKKPAWCYYDNDPINGKKYGKLYNWYAVNDERGLTPTGWKVPSKIEFEEMISFFGDSKKAALKMIANSDFCAGGFRFFRMNAGVFKDKNNRGAWWTSTEKDLNLAWDFDFDFRNKLIAVNHSSGKGAGASIKCIKQ
jgi:uncharacterized protein (TIGR02145 family)